MAHPLVKYWRRLSEAEKAKPTGPPCDTCKGAGSLLLLREEGPIYVACRDCAGSGHKTSQFPTGG